MYRKEREKQASERERRGRESFKMERPLMVSIR